VLPTKYLFTFAKQFQRRRCLEIDQRRRSFVNGSKGNEKSSTLKQLGQMDQNMVGSIYGRSSVKIANLVPIG
jgi:ATPase subunit of ABC transporter with duplicated ATPase domains